MAEAKRTKLYYHLKKMMENAVVEYGMIEEGDRVLVGVSGGADSLVLLDLLNTPMVFIPPFSVLAVNIDMGFDPAYEGYRVLAEYFAGKSFPNIMEKTDIGPLAHSSFNRKNPCFLCSRLRRKRLFEVADATGCNKIALAHHRDDIIETLLINMFYGREISTMMPKQTIFGGKLHIIRPLAYIREDLVKKYGREQAVPAVDNPCPTSKISRRVVMKRLIAEMEKDNGKIRENIWKSMTHVKVDYLPARLTLHDSSRRANR